MNKQLLATGLCLLLMTMLSHAQSDLHILKENQKAYKNKTRSKDGKPGINYWQNNVEYNIEVEVVPESRLIIGKETIDYSNNSPDDLREIVIRLYYDIFKKGNKRERPANELDIGDGVNLKLLSINGEKIDLDNDEIIKRTGTNLYITLVKPLKSKSQLTIDLEWEQKVQLTLGRVGAFDDTSFFIGYWYPQVAVYDDVFGWDNIDFGQKNEFYNNLSNFDVRIKVPENFLVWATGTLENSQEVYPDEIYNRYAKAQNSSEVIHVVASDDLKDFKLKSNTYHFKAIEVTDFAFAMSDHFLWDAVSQKVNDNNVLISSVFPKKDADEYAEITMLQRRAMKHFSEDAPGIAYPYPAYTTFFGNGSGGMEFPMMANNSSNSKGTAIHEMFHMYYPMYVRINESRFAWMDEGWADFFTSLVMHKYERKETETLPLRRDFYYGLQLMAGNIGDLPAGLSTQYSKENYGYQSYDLPAFIYYLIYNYFGEEKFMSIFQEYTRRWALKSPTPYDFFYTFEDVSGEDLNWMWEPWFYRLGYPDLAIKSFDKGELVIEKIGRRPIQLILVAEYDESFKGNEEKFLRIENASIWKDDTNTYKISIPDWEHIKSVSLNSDLPDFNIEDNFFPSLSSRYVSLGVEDKLTGVYEVKDTKLDFEVYKEDAVFIFKVPDWNNFEVTLIPVDKTNFESPLGDLKVSFYKENGQIESLTFIGEPYDIDMTAHKK